jgi:ABC-type proline/glycine betaine transport system permease subunit
LAGLAENGFIRSGRNMVTLTIIIKRLMEHQKVKKKKEEKKKLNHR